MKSAVWGICGVALGVVFVFVVGILSIQVAGRRLGAIVDLNNMVVAVTSARVAFLQMIATAALATIVMLLLTVATRKRAKRFRAAFVVGFSVTTLLLVLLSFVLAPFMGPVEGLSTGSIGFAPGWVGWLGAGGSSPAVHVIFLLAVASIWLYSGSRQPKTHSDSNTLTVQQ